MFICHYRCFVGVDLNVIVAIVTGIAIVDWSQTSVGSDGSTGYSSTTECDDFATVRSDSAGHQALGVAFGVTEATVHRLIQVHLTRSGQE